MNKNMWIIIVTLALCLSGFGNVWADDTDIYGGNTINLDPNVVIIFDTSGSMSNTAVAGQPYNSSTVYTGSYVTNRVYETNSSLTSINWFADSVSDLNCSTVVNSLNSYGYRRYWIRNSSGGYTCGGGTRRRLYTGNRLNYEFDTSLHSKSRMDVAKEVVSNLIDNNPNIRWGLMRFNNNEGGRFTTSGRIGNSHAAIKGDIAAFVAGGWTPLAETLAEAGLYFAGQNSWFNSSVSYTSPIDVRCRKNYVILMTDGFSTQDINYRLTSTPYVSGTVIGDYDNDGNDPGSFGDNGSDYLDDVAAYLLQNDLRTDLGVSGDKFEVQNVVTYTIGFQTTHQLLQDTADNGGGLYFTAYSYASLANALQEIINDISEVNAVFVSPVVPISRMNRVYAGNYLYIGFFKPQTSGNWLGNVKKYGLDSNGDLIDINNNPATLASGQIAPNAQSYWSASVDGEDVGKGGVGQLIANLLSRNLYTYMGSSTDLTHSSNAFAKTNSLIDTTELGVATTTRRDEVIDDIHGVSKSWMMNDVLHSEPAIVHYSTDSIIYTGTNGGMLHAFSDTSGQELWGFIPRQQLTRLQLLSDNVTTHEYFEDGVPTVHEDSSGNKTLMFGERRGGNYYHVLDVTSFSSPTYKYNINPNILGAANENLGQSWGAPQIATLANSTGSTEEVFLLPGGYDVNQDLAAPVATDSEGRAAFSVTVAGSGTSPVLSSFTVGAHNFSAMTHCVVDLAGVDPDGDGITNRIYAPDLGGNMFAFHDDDKDATWFNRKLFSASVLDGVQRKIFYAPDIIKIYDDATHQSGEMLFFGTGDRADPEESGVVNRFYAVKNYWETTGFSTYNENSLHDATDNNLVMGNASEKLAADLELQSRKGWFIRLENPGEKMISAPLVYGKVVYFTTYEPDTSGSTSTDPCDTIGGRGIARLYALDYETGIAADDFSTVVETDGDSQVVTSGGKADRSKIIGTSIPSAPVIAILEGGPKLYVGVEGGIHTEDPVATTEMIMYYWREITQ